MKSTVSKEETPQKFVAKIQYDHRICKVKKISLPVGNRPVPPGGTFDEAKAACKARKRKERQESLSSQQDRKVIRSNSEERPTTTSASDNSEDKNNGIRRVSSSGDFPKIEEKIKSPFKKQEATEKTLTYDDSEHDKRRSHERFAKSHNVLSRKHPNKRLKVRCSNKIKFKYDLQESIKRNVSTTITAQATQKQTLNLDYEPTKNTDNQDHDSNQYPDSCSPIKTTLLDFTTLHQQIEGSEPVLSHPKHEVQENIETMPSEYIASSRLMSSPRNSIIATHKIYLDPDIAQISLKKSGQNPVEERIQKINKQINSCKRKILISEADFEARNGTKPSQTDKLNDDIIRKLYLQLNKLKKEQKQLSEISVGCSRMNLSGSGIPVEKIVSLQETVKEIEQKLSVKREAANRNFDLESLTAEQLFEEKVATQKALLFLESIHGRPQSKEERDIVRPFYDRYRILKKMVARISNIGATGELATIHENEALNFVTPNTSSNETESEKTDDTPDKIEETNENENLHCLDKQDLLKQIKSASEEKKDLRRQIKEFEIEVQAKVCRMLTKEDKKPMGEVYAAYKRVKGQLRLLEALFAKY
ncbi:unnamed protein product [Ceutorhynchus assimilis]|uniref:FAM13A-like domain-containing protein n=1 Tax=Ceutorhynchus assimilis TaxID=467358 RepID=A0A9N9QN04_9CUCU|nr:unnamed protein product [Ceutorhynchus assimilis]